MENFEKKYQGTGYNIYHIIKSMGYFEDAEKEPMPQMIKACQWESIKDYFIKTQMQLTDQYLL